MTEWPRSATTRSSAWQAQLSRCRGACWCGRNVVGSDHGLGIGRSSFHFHLGQNQSLDLDVSCNREPMYRTGKRSGVRQLVEVEYQVGSSILAKLPSCGGRWWASGLPFLWGRCKSSWWCTGGIFKVTPWFFAVRNAKSVVSAQAFLWCILHQNWLSNGQIALALSPHLYDVGSGGAVSNHSDNFPKLTVQLSHPFHAATIQLCEGENLALLLHSWHYFCHKVWMPTIPVFKQYCVSPPLCHSAFESKQL